MSDSAGKIAKIDGEWREVVPPCELVELAGAVERFRAHPRGVVPSPIVGEELRELRHLIDLLELEFAKRAAEFAQSKGYDGICENVPFQWIRHETHMSGIATSNALNVGEQMATLPESTTAMNEGRIGFGHLALLASTAGAVRASSRDGRFDETALLTQATEHSVSRFRYDCAHARHAADAAGFLEEHVDAIEARRLELSPCQDGLLIEGRLDPVGGAALRTALEPLAKRNGKGDERLRNRRLADALVELAHHVLDAGTLPSHGSQRPHLQVTATLETLVGAPGAPAGELQFSSPIPAATVQRLGCDSSASRVLFGPKSDILDVGRARRVPSAPTRRALEARDKGCVWPGCDRPPVWTNAHHIEFWGRDNGSTEIPNLALVCLRHHTMLHEGGWQIARSEDGRWITIPPLPRHTRLRAGPEVFRRLMEVQAPDEAAAARVREFWDRSDRRAAGVSPGADAIDSPVDPIGAQPVPAPLEPSGVQRVRASDPTSVQPVRASDSAGPHPVSTSSRCSASPPDSTG